MKNNRGLGKTWNFFYLKLTILNVWDMSRGGSRAAATSKMERFVLIVKGF